MFIIIIVAYQKVTLLRTTELFMTGIMNLQRDAQAYPCTIYTHESSRVFGSWVHNRVNLSVEIAYSSVLRKILYVLRTPRTYPAKIYGVIQNMYEYPDDFSR